jgi:hypothetical protein
MKRTKQMVEPNRMAIAHVNIDVPSMTIAIVNLLDPMLEVEATAVAEQETPHIVNTNTIVSLREEENKKSKRELQVL